MMGKDLKVIDINDKNMLKLLKNCVQSGKSVLLQDVMETLDPSLDNLLNKSLIKTGSNEYAVKIGDSEVQYNKKFQLFITTRMANPTYTPEVSTKVNVVNFSIKEQGLEEQCLGIVVGIEQPSLEKSKNDLIEKIERGQNELKALEDSILTML